MEAEKARDPRLLMHLQEALRKFGAPTGRCLLKRTKEVTQLALSNYYKGWRGVCGMSASACVPAPAEGCGVCYVPLLQLRESLLFCDHDTRSKHFLQYMSPCRWRGVVRC